MDELLSHGSWATLGSIAWKLLLLSTAGVYLILFATMRRGWIEDRDREQQRQERKPPHID